MRRLLGIEIFLLLSFSMNAFGGGLELNSRNCFEPANKHMGSGNTAYLDKDITAENISKIYTDFYNGERNVNRIYMNSNAQFITSYKNQQIVIPNKFLQILTAQIQSALDQGFGEYLFFPDFGHGHLQPPENVEVSSIKYFLGNNDFSILYHSVEMYSGANYFREKNRNFFAYSFENTVSAIELNKGKTVFNVPGYQKSVFGFYIKGNKDGCFMVKLKGKPHFFDIKL